MEKEVVKMNTQKKKGEDTHVRNHGVCACVCSYRGGETEARRLVRRFDRPWSCEVSACRKEPIYAQKKAWVGRTEKERKVKR